MSKNKLIDLNDHLFAQLERLSDESVKGDELKEEIERSQAVGAIAKTIIFNANLALQAEKALGEQMINRLPAMIDVTPAAETTPGRKLSFLK